MFDIFLYYDQFTPTQLCSLPHCWMPPSLAPHQTMSCHTLAHLPLLTTLHMTFYQKGTMEHMAIVILAHPASSASCIWHQMQPASLSILPVSLHSNHLLSFLWLGLPARFLPCATSLQPSEPCSPVAH